MKVAFTRFSLVFLFTASAGYSSFSQAFTNSILATWGGHMDGFMTTEKILADSMVLYFSKPVLPQFKIHEFHVSMNINGLEIDIKNSGNKLSDEQKRLVNHCKVGSRLYIERIIVIAGKDTFLVNSIVLKIDGPRARLYHYRLNDPLAYKARTVLDSNELRLVAGDAILDGEAVSKKDVLQNDYIFVGRSWTENGGHDSNKQIISYEFICYAEGISQDTIAVKGDQITPPIKTIIKELKGANSILFRNIKAITKEGKTVDVGGMDLTVY